MNNNDKTRTENNSEKLLDQAISHIKIGDKKKAREFLAQILKGDPKNERAWLLLSRCVDSLDQKIDCLKRATEINPDNLKARARLARLQALRSNPEPPVMQRIKGGKPKRNLPIFLIVGGVIATICCITFAYFLPGIASLWGPPSAGNPPAEDVHRSAEAIGVAWVNAIADQNCTFASTLMQPGFENYPRFCDRPGFFALSRIRIIYVTTRGCTTEERADHFFPCTNAHRIVTVHGDVYLDDGTVHEWYEVQAIEISGRWYIDEDWDIGPVK